MEVFPGRDGFYDLDKNHYAHPIEHTMIYRFNANLFFANSKLFQEDIENNLKEDTKTVIVDAGTITSIDITAADTILMLKQNLEKKGIAFYITEHMQALNTQFRNLEMGGLIEEGCIRRTITAALLDSGFTKTISTGRLFRQICRKLRRIAGTCRKTACS